MMETDYTVDLRTLLEREIPDGRANLESSYSNLERVAAYCEANYIQATDKRSAFEETKRYTVQSLASVAYQINSLASSLIQAVELQTDKVRDMESQVNNIAQIVDIHKEKVARREIGVLTGNKALQRQAKILTPAVEERPRRYQRTPIDYSVLDDIGHGVKLASTGSLLSGNNFPGQQSYNQNSHHPAQKRHLLARTGSTVSGASSNSTGSCGPTTGSTSVGYQTAFPGSENLLPKGLQSMTSTISRGNTRTEHYRTPIYMTDVQSVYATACTPPAAKQQQPQQQQLLARQPSTAGNYSQVSVGATVTHGKMAEPPDMMTSHGYQNNTTAMTSSPLVHHMMTSSPRPHPPPQLAPVTQYRLSTDTGTVENDDPNASPPLPPPPMDDVITTRLSNVAQFGMDHQNYGAYYARNSNTTITDRDRGGDLLPTDWVPSNYVEKAIAIYDYEAQKADELSLNESAVVYILRKNEDGWFEGVLDGVTGLFPGNYVEPCA